MSKTESKGRAEYEKARDAFTKLTMQDKAAFVMEATFSTFGEAFKDAGQQFADVIEKVSSDDFFKGFAWECGDDHSGGESGAKEAAPGAEQPEAGPSAKKKKDGDDA